MSSLRRRPVTLLSLHDSESSFKSITLEDIKEKAFFVKKKYEASYTKSSARLTQGSFYTMIKNKISSPAINDLQVKLSENSAVNSSSMKKFIDTNTLPISKEVRNKMISMFSSAKHKKLPSTGRITILAGSPTATSTRSPVSRIFKQQLASQLAAKQPDVPECLRDKVVIVDHKPDKAKQMKSVKKAENLVSCLKGEYVDLRSRKKRVAVATNQSVICQDIVRTVEDLLHTECDEQEMYGLIESEFGCSSIFNTILFESRTKLRRLSPRSLHRLIFIRAEKSPGNKAAEIKALRMTVRGEGGDSKKKAKGRLN